MVWGTLVAALLASCVDTEIADVTVTKPESIAQYEYLNDYAPLKSYIDRAANPDFKLGLGRWQPTNLSKEDWYFV